MGDDGESSWSSGTSVDDTDRDPTYGATTSVGRGSRCHQQSVRRRGRGRGRDTVGPSTRWQVSDHSTLSSVSDESGDDGIADGMVASVSERINQLRARKKRKERCIPEPDVEPFKLGIADLPADFCWTDREPEDRPDFFQPHHIPGHLFDDSETPVEIFLKLFEPALEMLLKSMNECGQVLFKKFKIVDLDELLRFHSIMIYCQSVKITRWELYWRKKCSVYQPFVANQMSFKRFKQLKRCVKCYVPSEVLESGQSNPESQFYDPLYKITPMQNVLLQNFRRYRFPDKEVTIDEQMVKFKVENLTVFNNHRCLDTLFVL